MVQNREPAIYRRKQINKIVMQKKLEAGMQIVDFEVEFQFPCEAVPLPTKYYTLLIEEEFGNMLICKRLDTGQRVFRDRTKPYFLPIKSN